MKPDPLTKAGCRFGLISVKDPCESAGETAGLSKCTWIVTTAGVTFAAHVLKSMMGA
jgi:hypothetical protein